MLPIFRLSSEVLLTIPRVPHVSTLQPTPSISKLSKYPMDVKVIASGLRNGDKKFSKTTVSTKEALKTMTALAVALQLDRV